MEGEVGARHRGGVPRGDSLVDLVGEGAQLRDRRGVLGAGDQSRRAALQRGAQAIDLADVVGAEADHEGPTAWFLVEQSLGPEELERLAHRSTADVELLGDLGFDQVLALPEPARQDLLSDPVGGIFGEGTRRLQRLQRRRRRGFAHARTLACGCQLLTDDVGVPKGLEREERAGVEDPLDRGPRAGSRRGTVPVHRVPGRGVHHDHPGAGSRTRTARAGSAPTTPIPTATGTARRWKPSERWSPPWWGWTRSTTTPWPHCSPRTAVRRSRPRCAPRSTSPSGTWPRARRPSRSTWPWAATPRPRRSRPTHRSR